MMLISIILPVYNGEKHLVQSIESCLNQTYKNIELIIVNDCSTDTSLEIALRYKEKDNRVKVIDNLTNKKLPASLNIGHANANGELLTWTSHDNFYEPNALEILSQELLKNNSDLVYSDMNLVYENSDKIKKRDLNEIESLPFGNCIGASFLYKKKVFLELNGYNEKLFLVEDYDFWLRAFLKFKFFHVKDYLYNYTLQSESLTNQINLNEEKRNLWLQNITSMYNEFLNSFEISNLDISNFLKSNLTFEPYDFNLITSNYSSFRKFEEKLLETPNYKSKSSLKKAIIKQFKFSISNNKGNIKKNIYFFLQNYYKYFDLNDYKFIVKKIAK
jgi:glycosyltransferase involved in cell wall biosynthesis